MVLIKTAGRGSQMQRDYRADLLRVCACAAVIAIHANSYYHPVVGTVQETVQMIYDMLICFAVPAFVMLSGALLLDPKYDESPRVIIRKRVLPLLATGVFWSVIYTIYDWIRWRQSHTAISFLLSVVSGYYHMWFLYMIALLYLTLPILRHIMLKREIVRWYLILWFLMAVVVKTVESIPYTKKLADIWNERAYPQFLLGYTGYFLLGRYLVEASMPRRRERQLLVIGVSGLLGGIVLSYVISRQLNVRFRLNDSFELPAFLYTTGLFCAIMRILPKGRGKHPQLARLSGLSLDIWMVHVLCLNLLFVPSLFRTMPVAVGVPLVTAACWLCSCFVALALGAVRKKGIHACSDFNLKC